MPNEVAVVDDGQIPEVARLHVPGYLPERGVGEQKDALARE
jgi:hypothetical protein